MNDARPSTWAGDAAAAVSLTYDDGLPDALDRAVPDLEDRGLRGTFYLTTGKRCVRRRAADWRRAFERGHEIGSHSAHHPCRADAYPRPPRWLAPELRLEGWSAERTAAELAEAADWLRDNIGEDPWRTYAYPCGATAIGAPPDTAAYGEAVRRHHFAARAAGGGPNDPATVDLLRIRSLMCVRPALADLVRFCEEARRANGWAVLMFHSIGGWRLRTGRSVHRGFLEFLVREGFWVAPVRDVARHIVGQRDCRKI
jgi:peptidoglycan/xylan/chitin deacetylase (PgdA/CDA1 family)